MAKWGSCCIRCWVTGAGNWGVGMDSELDLAVLRWSLVVVELVVLGWVFLMWFFSVSVV